MDRDQESAFVRFVGSEQIKLLRFAMILTSNARLSRDIVSDVIGRTYEHWGQIGPVEAPYGYVRRMVLNDYLSFTRSLRRTAPQADVSGQVSDDFAPGHAERDEMLRNLASLPRKQRAVLVLRFYESLTDSEIAEVLGCTPSTVRSQLARGLAKMRIEIGEHPVTLTRLPATGVEE